MKILIWPMWADIQYRFGFSQVFFLWKRHNSLETVQICFKKIGVFEGEGELLGLGQKPGLVKTLPSRSPLGRDQWEALWFRGR